MSHPTPVRPSRAMIAARLVLVFALLSSSLVPLWSPQAVAAPAAQQPSALLFTKTAHLVNDVDGDGRADPGDTLRYTIGVTNTATTDRADAIISDTLDAALSLVPASVAVSPLAMPDAYAATTAAQLRIDAPGLLANDRGTPPPTVEAGAITTARGGSATLNADGSFTYTPPAGFTGEDSFVYRAQNRAGRDQATVTITVRSGPAANDDRFATPRDQQLQVASPGVLANDSGTPPLTVQAFSGATAQNGSVTLNADGSFTYTPPSGFTGDDQFTYTLQNAVGSDQATVTIAVGLPPQAVDDSGWTAVAGRALNVGATGGLLSNDQRGVPAGAIVSFGGGSLGGSVGDHGAGATASFGNGGTLRVNADGSFSLTPPADLAGTVTFGYRLANELGASDATVTVVVQRAPQAVNDGPYRTGLEQDLRVDAPGLLANDGLGDPAATLASFGGGSLSGSVDDHAAGTSVALAGGTLTVGADGALTLTQPTQPGTYTFQYRLSNAAGDSQATVTIVVQAPPLAADDAYTMQAGTTLRLAASDAGAPLTNDDRGVPLGTIASFGGGSLDGDVTAYDAGAVVPLAGGSLMLGADGALTLTQPTQPGTYTFQYRLSNAVGDADATITIVVQASPRAVDDSYAVALGQTLSRGAADGLLQNDDPGAPAGAIVSFGGGSLGGSVSDHAAGTSVTIGSDGALTVNADGSFSFTPPSTGSGERFEFRYRLANSLGSADATVTIAIQDVPQAQPDSYTAVRRATLSQGADRGLLANDRLGAPPATLVSFGGGTLGGTVDSYTAGGTVPLGSGGALTVRADGSFTFTPAADGPATVTFEYRIRNDVGSATATVTITVQTTPAAVDDGPYTVVVSDSLSLAAGDGLLANDGLGDPAATLASFGGGSLGGSVDDHGAGTSVALAGGTLTVGADGALTLTQPTQPGTYTVQYRLSNAAGDSQATVTIVVVDRPVAIDDGVAADSAPGDPYHTALNTPLNIGSGDATRLLANDRLGAPPATLVSFGAIELAQADGSSAPPLGDVTSYAAGTSVDLGNGGTLTVHADGALTLVPPRDYTGYVRFAYRLANAAGSDDALVTLAVGVRPQANADVYPDTLVGNVWVDSTARSFSVLANDRGDGLTLGAASSSYGDVTLRPDGTFVFDPRPGYEGEASFSYTLRNGFGVVTGTVSLRIAGMIWFIDNSRSSDGDGRFSAPFNRLESFQALNDGQGDHPAAGDVIFLFSGSGPYTGGVTLLDRQRLIGQGAGGDLATLSGLRVPTGSPALPPTGGVRPVLTGTVAITVAADNAIHGLNVGDTGDSDVAGTAFGTLTIRDVDLQGQGRALNLVNGTLDARFGELSASSGSDGARLVDVGGTLEAARGTLAGGAGAGLWIERGALTLTYAGSVTQQNDAPVIVVRDTTGGSLAINGGASGSGNRGLQFSDNRASISLGTVFLLGTTAPALRLERNAAPITLNALNVYNSRSNQPALIAGDQTGALRIGTGTLTTGNAAAVQIASAVGATPLEITLTSITTSGAATSVLLRDTGGFFTVQGRDRADSGGVIQNASAPAIVLERAQNVSLNWLRLSGQRDLALRADGVSNLTLANSVIQGARGMVGVAAQSGLALSELTGTVVVDRTSVSDVTGNALALTTTAGSLTLTVRDSQFSNADAGLVIHAEGGPRRWRSLSPVTR